MTFKRISFFLVIILIISLNCISIFALPSQEDEDLKARLRNYNDTISSLSVEQRNEVYKRDAKIAGELSKLLKGYGTISFDLKAVNEGLVSLLKENIIYFNYSDDELESFVKAHDGTQDYHSFSVKSLPCPLCQISDRLGNSFFKNHTDASDSLYSRLSQYSDYFYKTDDVPLVPETIVKKLFEYIKGYDRQNPSDIKITFSDISNRLIEIISDEYNKISTDKVSPEDVLLNLKLRNVYSMVFGLIRLNNATSFEVDMISDCMYSSMSESLRHAVGLCAEEAAVGNISDIKYEKSLSKFQDEINFALNVAIGLGCATCIIFIIISIVKLNVAGDHPMLKHAAMSNLFKASITFALLGGIRVVTYLIFSTFLS